MRHRLGTAWLLWTDRLLGTARAFFCLSALLIKDLCPIARVFSHTCTSALGCSVLRKPADGQMVLCYYMSYCCCLDLPCERACAQDPRDQSRPRPRGPVRKAASQGKIAKGPAACLCSLATLMCGLPASCLFSRQLWL